MPSPSSRASMTGARRFTSSARSISSTENVKRSPDPGSAAAADILRNDWISVGFSIRLLADAFWLRSTNMGGSGVDKVRFPSPIRGGDVIHSEIRVIEARPLKTRHGIGMVKSACTSVNQRGAVVASFDVTTFLRMRP